MKYQMSFTNHIAYRVYPIYNYFAVNEANRLLLDFLVFFLVVHHWKFWKLLNSRNSSKGET